MKKTRVNNTNQTKKIHKKKLKVKNFLIVIVMGCLCFLAIYQYSNLSLQRIIITGNASLKDNDIIKLASLESYPKFIKISSNKVKKALLTNPLIDTVNYVPDDIYMDLIKGLKNIDSDVRALISEIEYSPSKDNAGEILDDTRFILRMNDGNTVHMNTININKLNSYINIFSTTDMPSKKGVLYLDSRTENVVFKTYEAIKEEEAKKESEVNKDELSTNNG